MISIASHVFGQLPVASFGTFIGAEIVDDSPVSLCQTSNYIMTMSMITSTSYTTISSINSRIKGNNAESLNQSHVTTNAFFHLEGVPFYDYIITLPPFIALTKSGEPDMIIDAPTVENISKSDNSPTGTLVASLGKTDFTVNGTLDIGEKASKGTYVGTFALVVNCN